MYIVPNPGPHQTQTNQTIREAGNTHKLFNIDRSEPDPSLFEPPPGYAVKNERGEFTISWNTAR